MLKHLRPDYAAVCWDEACRCAAPSFSRNTRRIARDMPPDMVTQLPQIRDLVPKLGLHGVSLPDTEADDLMASYCCTAHAKGIEVILATNDKDLLSLVEDDILIYSTAKAICLRQAMLLRFWVLKRSPRKWGVPRPASWTCWH